MKKKLILTLLTLIPGIGFTQTIDFDLINYKGIKFNSTEAEIVEILGKPDSTYEPNYECGFLSSDWQETTYFTLEYLKIKFTGNQKEKYLIEEINFENDKSVILKYGNHKLTCETELTELAEIFGKELKIFFKNSYNGNIVVPHKNGDDGMRIEIKNGKLVRFKYWSPC